MEHKIDHKTEVGCQRKEVSLGVRGQGEKNEVGFLGGRSVGVLQNQ